MELHKEDAARLEHLISTASGESLDLSYRLCRYSLWHILEYRDHLPQAIRAELEALEKEVDALDNRIAATSVLGRIDESLEQDAVALLRKFVELNRLVPKRGE